MQKYPQKCFQLYCLLVGHISRNKEQICKILHCFYTFASSFNVEYFIKDLSMMYRALCDRRHEGATRIS